MTYQERADQLADLIETQLGIRGASLERKLKKAGRLLPTAVHRNAQQLLSAIEFQDSPKLARMVDEVEVIKAYSMCEKYLVSIDAQDRRRGNIINFLATNAFNLIAITGVVLAVLVWRGFL